MFLTRRQVIALLLGAAGFPAIAAASSSHDEVTSVGWAFALDLKVGDILTFESVFPRQWIVCEVFPPGQCEVARMEPFPVRKVSGFFDLLVR